MSKRLHIAALGSSFAAGPGIQPLSNSAASRSSKNYASILSQQLDARLTDLTVSGATLRNVLCEPQRYFRAVFEPQLASLPGDADLVTLTAGGNDIGYIGQIFADEFRAATWLDRFLSAPTSAGVPTLEELTESFLQVIDRIREIAPAARILVVEYLTLFGDHVKAGRDVWMSAERIAAHRFVAEKLAEAQARAVEARPFCELVPVAEMSRAHGLGSEQPWVTGLSWAILAARQTPFHPNAEGMEAVARVIYDKVKGGHD